MSTWLLFLFFSHLGFFGVGIFLCLFHFLIIAYHLFSYKIWLWLVTWFRRELCKCGRTHRRTPARVPSYKLHMSLRLRWAKVIDDDGRTTDGDRMLGICLFYKLNVWAGRLIWAINKVWNVNIPWNNSSLKSGCQTAAHTFKCIFTSHKVLRW